MRHHPWKVLSLCVVFVGLVATVGGFFAHRELDVPLPIVPPVRHTLWLDQNWSRDQRAFFHYAAQGSTTFGIPYEWFMALERPVLSLSSPGLLSDSDYLDRFGFIPSDVPGKTLPIGFEYGTPMVNATTRAHWTNPQTNEDMTTIGLTCAACHTGRMTYKGTAIYVDGAGALISIDAIRRGLALSLYMTRYLPFRFDRFSDRLIGRDASPAAKKKLGDTLDKVIEGYDAVRKLDTTIASRSVTEGIGRLDALNRIGNQLFALGLGINANYAPTTAPVRYPQLWDTSWFDWVQFNSSIQQPMIRNAGQALGLGVQVDLTTKPKPTLRSNMPLDNIFAMEMAVKGNRQPTFAAGSAGLRSPKWPEIFPAVDQARVPRGAALYASLCQGCHLPPVNTPAYYDPKLRQDFGPHAVKLVVVPISKIGTDPAEAADFADRKVQVPADLALASDAFGPALGELVEKSVQHWYDTQTPPVSPERRRVMDGDLPNGIRTALAYKARPLDGIWANAPYLHNGSVPTLYALLQPVVDRPKTFTIGSREFDPVDVGLRTDPISGGTLVDTSVRGDRNTGHEFDDAPGRRGVIGRKLGEEERRDLVEFLKTL